jgi:DNA-binding GntR family transcriptional regulator
MDVISLQGLFANFENTVIKRGELTVRATLMNEEEANLLRVSLPAAAFCLEHTFYDFKNQPISVGSFICHSDHLHFTTHVGLHDPTQKFGSR